MHDAVAHQPDHPSAAGGGDGVATSSAVDVQAASVQDEDALAIGMVTRRISRRRDASILVDDDDDDMPTLSVVKRRRRRRGPSVPLEMVNQSTQTEDVEGVCTACSTDVSEHPLVKRGILPVEVAKQCYLPMKTTKIKRSRKSAYLNAILTSDEAMKLCREKEEIKCKKASRKGTKKVSKSKARSVCPTETVEEEDICVICDDEFPPDSNADSFNWMACSMCDTAWAHRECTGLAEGENVFLCQSCMNL